MQLYTSINVSSKGKEAGKNDGFLCCTLGLGEGSKKTPNMSVLEEEICYLSSSHQTPCGTDSCGAEEVLILPSSQLYNSIIECSHASCSSHSANALYPVDVFFENINELHEPCYDHGSGLQTVLLHNAYLQRTCMVQSEFSLTEKINLFFTYLTKSPPPQSLLFDCGLPQGSLWSGL